MSQKTILITGAAGHVGRAVVSKFLADGWVVIGLVHHLKPVSQSKDSHEKNYHEFAIDLNDTKATESLIDQLFKTHKTIDAAVLTVGGFAMGSIEETSLDQIKAMTRINFETAYNAARPLFTHFKTQASGKLFFIGSTPGIRPELSESMVAYSLAKAQLVQLAKIINGSKTASKPASEKVASNDQPVIQAHVVVPTTIDVPLARQEMPDADFSTWVSPDEIAQVIAKYANVYDANKTVIEVIGEVRR